MTLPESVDLKIEAAIRDIEAEGGTPDDNEVVARVKALLSPEEADACVDAGLAAMAIEIEPQPIAENVTDVIGDLIGNIVGHCVAEQRMRLPFHVLCVSGDGCTLVDIVDLDADGTTVTPVSGMVVTGGDASKMPIRVAVLDADGRSLSKVIHGAWVNPDAVAAAQHPAT